MGRTKHTTTHLLRVKELLQAGFSTREIATKLSINKSSIAELAKWVPESEYVKRTPGRSSSPHTNRHYSPEELARILILQLLKLQPTGYGTISFICPDKPLHMH